MEILNQTVASSISESKQISECDVAEWEEMKQMSLIEMDGFLKGKCIPRDLKVNETNAEYLVRKFGELESKLETALRECRSAGITIDNLEAKCAALAAKINVINELMEVAEQVNKLAQEETEKLAHERNTLAAENAMLKQRTQQLIDIISNTDNDYCMCGSAMKDHVHGGCGYPTGMFDYYYNQWLESDNKTPATDAFLAEVRAQGVEMFADHLLCPDLDDTIRDFAAQLRKGGNQ